MRECTQRGRAPPKPQTERGRPGRPQRGTSAPEAPPPKKRSGPSQGTPEGRKHPFPPHPPRQWEDPPERPRAEDPPSKGRSKGRTARASIKPGDRCHTEFLGGASPTFPWMQDIPERLRLRLGGRRGQCRGLQSRPSSCCTLGRMMRGSYLHAYNQAFSEYIWAVDIRRMGEEPYSTMCSMAMAGKVALVGGGPNCRTWSILRWFPKPGGPPPVRSRAEQTLWGLEDLEPRVMEDTDNDSVLMLRQMYLTSLAYKGLGQLTVPQVGSSSWSTRWTRWSAARARAQRGAHRSGSRGPTFNERVHSTTPSSSSMSAAWARWL